MRLRTIHSSSAERFEFSIIWWIAYSPPIQNRIVCANWTLRQVNRTIPLPHFFSIVVVVTFVLTVSSMLDNCVLVWSPSIDCFCDWLLNFIRIYLYIDDGPLNSSVTIGVLSHTIWFFLKKYNHRISFFVWKLHFLNFT